MCARPFFKCEAQLAEQSLQVLPNLLEAVSSASLNSIWRLFKQRQLTQYEVQRAPTEKSCGECPAVGLGDARQMEAVLQRSGVSGAVAETSRTELNY